jgi:glycerol-3-phosphate dehydrogenase
LERSYTGSDPIGIELSGALKNVYAIAAGMADGLGFENNTRASKSGPEIPFSRINVNVDTYV